MKTIISILLSFTLLMSGVPMAVQEDRQASVPVETLQQDGKTKNLEFQQGEMKNLEQDSADLPEGYHSEISRTIRCRHTAAAINASIKCNKAGSALNPSANDLTGGVVLTGLLNGQKYTAKVENYDAGGTRNTVSHLRLKVTVNAGGIDNQAFDLAYPYVCTDGYAGYAYIENHFAYCPNTEKFYTVASSHVWLGCTRGDSGNPEFHPTEYEHVFNVYKQVPNNYKVAYNANGGTGNAKTQNATYGKDLTLNNGANFNRTGYILAGWNTKKDGTGTAYTLGQTTKNLATTNGGTVTLYAQWTTGTLIVQYNENGGKGSQNAPQNILTYIDKWSYGTEAKDPADFSTFGLHRSGYRKKTGAEWNTKADGTGRSFDENRAYSMTDYAPDLASGDCTITLYAQWEPEIHTVTLDNQLTVPDNAGTPRLYEKVSDEFYFDSGCTNELKYGNGGISIPKKKGYRFIGYYTGKNTGALAKFAIQKIDASGMLSPKGSVIDLNGGNDRTWYAWYDYLVSCEDYADIPCDIVWEDGYDQEDEDDQEDISVRLSYNSLTRSVTASLDSWRSGYRVTLTGQPAGTKVGEFTSAIDAGSTSGNTRSGGQVQMSVLQGIYDGTAYHLEVSKGGETFCSRMIYYEDGRFRMLAKLGEQKAKAVAQDGSIAGSAWGTDEEYDLYQYHGCTELTDVKEPGTVQRYFRYKEVNMAYSGNGATAGTNTLEYDVSLEHLYQFRDNEFVKEKSEKKYTADHKEYECKVKYSFQGWEMITPVFEKAALFAEKEQKELAKVYQIAQSKSAISDHTADDSNTYQKFPAVASGEPRAKEYINLRAKWDSFPTITVTPGDKLEFYEGEEVTKADLIRHLTTHDKEDNTKMDTNPDLNDSLRIVKVSYPESQNRSQAAYEKTYEKDVPEDFLLDTYYLKLEKDETVDVRVTFAVTDSAGNTTEEEIPVKVKYNYYPEISSEDVFYYLKEEANRGEITAEALIRRAAAQDKEDGDLTVKLALKDFEEQDLKMQTTSKAEFDVTYQVTDAYKKTTYRTVRVVVWDEDASIAEMPKYYVRYISEKYLDTLEEGSAWREPENLTYLREILQRGTPMETWDFTHEDVLAVQEWITQDGEGHWKLGQEANREFLMKFAYCRR